MQSLRSCRTVAAVLSLLLVWLCCLQRAAAQTGTGGTTTNRAPISHTIRGKVFLPSGHPPDMRVRVVLEANTGGIAGETFTDSVGNFEFRSVSNNNYRVTAHTDQRTFETTQEQLEVSGSFSRTFNVQIYLREKDAERAILKDKLLSVADTQEAPKNARKLYEKALKLARDDKHQDALAPLKEALQLFPDYLLALNKLGEEHARLEQLTEAQVLFERALAVNTKYALPHINLGIVHLRLKRNADAVKELEAGNALDDSFPMGHLNLGIALMNSTPPDYERAEKEFNRALQINGKELAHVHLYLFNLFSRRKDYPKAVEQLDAYLKDAPNAPDADAVRQRRDAMRKALAQQAAGKLQ